MLYSQLKASTMNVVWRIIWPKCVHDFLGFAKPETIKNKNFENIVALANDTGFEDIMGTVISYMTNTPHNIWHPQAFQFARQYNTQQATTSCNYYVAISNLRVGH